MKIIITIVRGFSKIFGEFEIKSSKIKRKDGTIREELPKMSKATGGPVPPIKIEKDVSGSSES